MLNRIILFLLLSISFTVAANKGPGEIYVNLQKLHSLKRVLYVAAHPDDENTRALAWFSLGENAETAYFSLTRGDGGQNLIGDELSEKLGVLRTQELLAARSYDGAKQYFSRAVDFGYSKSAEESFEKWGKEGLLEDLVLMIRKFQPDVIVTRFPPDERAGHGHHTASAELAIEAFQKAADPEFLPQQVKSLGTWKTTSIYWNTSYWWDENIKDLAEGDPNYLITDIGGYNPLLGMSYNEIGTIARSQHKCQGFGAIIERGSREEYFKHLDGEKLEKSFFEKNNREWNKLINADFDEKLNALLDNFDFVSPEKNVPELLEILNGLETLPNSFFKNEKINRCRQIIMDCLGLYAELSADDYSFVAGTSVPLKLNLINRSNTSVDLKSIVLNTNDKVDFTESLTYNKEVSKEINCNGDVPYSTPFWLENPFENVFEFDHSKYSGTPENTPSIVGKVTITIDGEPFNFELPATYKWRDPAFGERERPLIATPEFTANFEQDILLMKAKDKKQVRIRIHSFKDNLTDTLRWKTIKGWNTNVNEIPIHVDKKHGEVWVTLEVSMVSPKAMNQTLQLKDSEGNTLFQLTEISYDHIPTQAILSPAAIKCIGLNAEIVQGKVAYINGVVDAVPQAIAALGFAVDVFEVSDIPNIDFSSYSSVVLGIRVYNVHPELHNYDEKLFKYVENGGNLIMQYNTASRSGSNEFGPKPFELSRNRVTEEDAEVTFLDPKHTILNTPNKIYKEDFEGWVQERGLYFAGEWDDAYTPLLSWHDRGEEPVEGGLIVLKHGDGQFVYTGISFFRELPKGVTGAYRLFANLLSYKP